MHRSRSALSLLLVACLAASAASVRAGSTSESVAVGGLGTFGCQGPEDPPALGGGVPASGTIGYAYDDATGILTLTVENTSEVTAGVPNPLITRVWINLPHLAVSGVTLLSQSGAGGATPGFTLAVDTDNLDAIGSVHANCFGKMGLMLRTGGGSIAGGIANASADTLPGPPGAAVIGPAVFELQVTGPGTDTLTADSFAGALSAIPPGSTQVHAALKFQGGGLEDASGSIGNGPGCRVGAWMVGEPNIGNTIEFVMSAPEGCHACLVGSDDPGPILVAGVSIPVGKPFFPILIHLTAPPTPVVRSILIPNDPGLVGIVVYCAAAAVDPVTLLGLNVIDQFSFTIGA